MSRAKLHIPARRVGTLTEAVINAMALDAADVSRFGIQLSARDASVLQRHAQELAGSAMDALTPTIYPATGGTPVQYLQNMLPGIIRVLNQVRMIDELTGVTTVGDWEDEEVVQGGLEYTGRAVPYGDYANIPLSSWNYTYERRTVVRFEEGLKVGRLEEARAAKMQVNSLEEKRGAAALALDIQRNAIGFYGFNGGQNRTYGFLNDPNLPAYVNVDTSWADASFLQITQQLREMFAALRIQMGGNLDPKRDPLTLAVALSAVDYLTVTSPEGFKSVQEWLNENYPNVRVIGVPQLDEANGGDNVAVLYPETVADTGTDGGRVFTQIVPVRFRLLGTEQQAKAIVEDYTNASAGVMLARPYAVVRRSGI